MSETEGYEVTERKAREKAPAAPGALSPSWQDFHLPRREREERDRAVPGRAQARTHHQELSGLTDRSDNCECEDRDPDNAADRRTKPTHGLLLLRIYEGHLQSANGTAYPQRSLPWTGSPILDACTIHSDRAHLLVLTSDGALHGIDLDTGADVRLCSVALPDLALGRNSEHFGAARYRLHASSDGRYAAIVVDEGRNGIVVDTQSGAVTMHLDGGDYHEDTVPFSACFLRYKGRNVLVHRTAWNRLDAADPATGESLTDRHIAPSAVAGESSEHFLDYFHGQLRPSPDGSLLFDDGWVWQPVSIPRVWSVTHWLGGNPWESEDGPSIVDLTMRDDWTTPACWISEQHLALWGLADWDEDEFAEIGQGPGVRIFDVTQRKQASTGRWPMEIQAKRVFDLFSDGARLFVAADTGTTVWDLASRAHVAALPGLTARMLDKARNTLVAIEADLIIELPLSWAAPN